MTKDKITIEATINAVKTIVWEYYTQTEHIVKWNFASDDWCCPYAENDMQIGGIYRARMEAKDGSFGFDFEAIYGEITPLESFRYGLDGRDVFVTFERLGSQTKVVVAFDPENENPVEMQRNGWQAILNNFKAYVESV